MANVVSATARLTSLDFFWSIYYTLLYRVSHNPCLIRPHKPQQLIRQELWVTLLFNATKSHDPSFVFFHSHRSLLDAFLKAGFLFKCSARLFNRPLHSLCQLRSSLTNYLRSVTPANACVNICKILKRYLLNLFFYLINMYYIYI